MTSMNNDWNPRYLAYCRATGGLSPDATLERDREQYPGGCMCGFILWINDMITKCREAHPEHFYVDIDRKVTRNLISQEGFDKFINETVGAQ